MRLRRLARQAQKPAEEFVRRLAATVSAEQAPLIQELSTQSHAKDHAAIDGQNGNIAPSAPLPATAATASTPDGVGVAVVTSRVAAVGDVFTEAFRNCDGDFGQLTSYLRVTAELRSIAHLHAFLRVLGRQMAEFPAGVSGDDEDPMANIADVLSFCVAPVSTGQVRTSWCAAQVRLSFRVVTQLLALCNSTNIRLLGDGYKYCLLLLLKFFVSSCVTACTSRSKTFVWCTVIAPHGHFDTPDAPRGTRQRGVAVSTRFRSGVGRRRG